MCTGPRSWWREGCRSRRIYVPPHKHTELDRLLYSNTHHTDAAFQHWDAYWLHSFTLLIAFCSCVFFSLIFFSFLCSLFPLSAFSVSWPVCASYTLCIETGAVMVESIFFSPTFSVCVLWVCWPFSLLVCLFVVERVRYLSQKKDEFVICGVCVQCHVKARFNNSKNE